MGDGESASDSGGSARARLRVGSPRLLDLLDHSVHLDDDFEAKHPRDHGKFVAAGGVSGADRARLKALTIPPGWTHVRLNTDPKADLQAVGIDAKGRAQYRYHAAHAASAAAEKFARLKAFTAELPSIRQQVLADLKNRSLSAQDRDSAAVLYLIDQTGFRVGSDRETGAEVQAYGASTLLARQVHLDGDTATFRFIGKKGVQIEQTLTDHRLAQILAPRLKAGGRLFPATTDAHVRDYLHARDGLFKVKDFRTSVATVTALRAIKDMPMPTSAAAFARAQRDVSVIVAAKLGNRPAEALKSYIDPAVFARWKARTIA